ncbi:odorant receptor 38 [Nasonia vitripennis]|uniref:Odorant receptor n=1 Tax=Nasonia vitripennis TaxID=7425 RepID=A0A7M6USE3_NASVI|nr:odorant receptor 38 [Nasonia vitripennis]
MKSNNAHESFFAYLNWAIGLNRLSLRLMGIWPDDSVAETKLFTTILRIPLIISVMMLCIVVPQMYALILVRNNLLLIIDNFMTSFPTLIGCAKFYFLWRSKEVLRPVVCSVTEDWLRPKSDLECQKMRDAAVVARLFTVGGYSLITGSLMGFIIAPLCGLNIRVEQNITDYGRQPLLVQSYYPYDYSQSPNFEITHSSQIVAACFVAMSLAVPDNYFGALVFHISGQFQLLGLNFEHFIKQNEKIVGIMAVRDFNKSLGVYVDRHVHLIRMVAIVEKSFNFIILIQIFCLCVMACCLGVRILSAIGNPNDKTAVIQIINLGATLISLMIFAFSNCYASETLASRSAEIFQQVYSSDWYKIPKRSTCCYLIMIMIMSKNPQMLSAGKILYLSLSTFCIILKSIAGYLSVLIAQSN